MKSLFLCFLLVFAANALMAQSADRLVSRAQKDYEDGAFRQAYSHLQAALKADPNHAGANYWMAKALLELGPERQALAHMEKVKKAQGTIKEDQQKVYARSLHVHGRWQEAKAAYQAAPLNRKMTHIYTEQCETGKRLMANPVKARVSPMGRTVNTAYDEYMPFVTADQMMLFFTSRRPGSTGGETYIDGKPYEDIYLCVNSSGSWSAPKQLSKRINTEKHEACAGVSNDGQTMYLYKGTNGGDLYTSTLKGDKWSKPEPLPFNTEHYESQASLSPDERTLYFVSDRSGDKDIYYVRKTYGGKWSSPRMMSSGVNSSFDESSPYMHPDGKTLYFSSKGHSTMGGYDIFKVNTEKPKELQEAQNLGYPINTPGDDLYFSVSASGKYGYFSSNREEGKGGHDLYSVVFPPPKEKGEEPELTLLKGEVKEALSGKPLEAQITVTDNQKNETVAKLHSNAKTGRYVVALPAGKNYGISVSKDGHLFHSENVQLSKKKGFEELEKDIEMVNVEPGSKVVLENIFFQTGEAKLQRSSIPELRRIYDLMKEKPRIRVEISGHTDNVGSAASNRSLSEQRAQAVKDFLVRKGIEASRLKAVGHGESQPIATNQSEAGRAKNRRTEFKVIR